METPPIPVVTAAQMAEVDRIIVEELGLDILQIMELAGLAVAAFASRRFLGDDPRGKRIIVLAGSGGNGGDGLVAARHLHLWGANVDVRLGRRPAAGSGAPAQQLRALDNLGLSVREPERRPELPPADLIIDALLGFSLTSPPTGETAALITAANAHPAPILAVDLPSGLEATDGTIFEPCIRADVTLTLGLPKTGLLAPAAAAVTGEVIVADIGLPAAAYSRLGLSVGPIFARAPWVPLSPSTRATGPRAAGSDRA